MNSVEKSNLEKMEVKDLYKKLGDDFIKGEYSDDWSGETESIKDLLTDEFNEKYMGLMFDGGAEEIEKVYTAVFPSKEVLQTIVDSGNKNSLLLVHHAATWDLNDERVFIPVDRNLLEKFRENKISIYCLHVPLDDFGKYSTSVGLAQELGLKNLEKFAPYNGAMAGVVGKSRFADVERLRDKLKEAVGHDVAGYLYGDQKINNDLVGVAGGGGLNLEILQDLKKQNINLFVTGVTTISSYTRDAHEFAKENQINILGATHYSTEKFAMKNLIEYFDENLESEFVEEKPCLLDL